MHKITPAQLRKIHALARARGIDGDTLHSHVYGLAKKESLKLLTIREAVKVIDSLAGEGGRAPAGMMTGKQRRHIDGLLIGLGWTDADGAPDWSRLAGFARERFGIVHMNWVTAKAASQIIEGLKAIKARAGMAI